MIPPLHTHTHARTHASPFLMHTNEYALSLLPLGNWTCLSLSSRWSHASGREFRVNLCYVLRLKGMYCVFSEAFSEVGVISDHVTFLSGNSGNYLREQNLFKEFIPVPRIELLYRILTNLFYFSTFFRSEKIGWCPF